MAANFETVKAQYLTVRPMLEKAIDDTSIAALLKDPTFNKFLDSLYELVDGAEGSEIFTQFYEVLNTGVFVKVISNSLGNNKDTDRMYNVVGAMKNNKSHWPYFDKWLEEGGAKPWLEPWSKIYQTLEVWRTRFGKKKDAGNPLDTKRYDQWSDMTEEEQQAVINSFLAKATQNAFDKASSIKKSFEQSISNDEEFSNILKDQLGPLFKNELHMDMNQKNVADMLDSLANYYNKSDSNKDLVDNINFVKDIVRDYGKNLEVLRHKDDNVEDFANGNAPTNDVHAAKEENGAEQQAQEA